MIELDKVTQDKAPLVPETKGEQRRELLPEEGRVATLESAVAKVEEMLQSIGKYKLANNSIRHIWDIAEQNLYFNALHIYYRLRNTPAVGDLIKSEESPLVKKAVSWAVELLRAFKTEDALRIYGILKKNAGLAEKSKVEELEKEMRKNNQIDLFIKSLSTSLKNKPSEKLDVYCVLTDMPIEQGAPGIQEIKKVLRENDAVTQKVVENVKRQIAISTFSDALDSYNTLMSISELRDNPQIKTLKSEFTKQETIQGIIEYMRNAFDNTKYSAVEVSLPMVRILSVYQNLVTILEMAEEEAERARAVHTSQPPVPPPSNTMSV